MTDNEDVSAIEVDGDEATRRGYVLLPKFILLDTSLSAGAKLTFGCLMAYSWQTDSAYPGQQRLADDMGVTSLRTVQGYLKELVDAGHITSTRRGLGRTNLYKLRVRQRSPASASVSPDAQKIAHPEAQSIAHLMRSGLRTNTTQLNIKQTNKESKLPTLATHARQPTDQILGTSPTPADVSEDGTQAQSTVLRVRDNYGGRVLTGTPDTSGSAYFRRGQRGQWK